MPRWVWLFATAALIPPAVMLAATPAHADSGCPGKKKKSGFGSFLGSVAGSVASSRMGSMGMGYTGYLISNKLNAVLIDAIACRLSPQEREKAADATTRVVEKRVGATESWASDTRDASGSSTVTAETKLADGAVCKDVRDVATIDGEEQTVTKRMCRAPGQAGYKMQVAQG